MNALKTAPVYEEVPVEPEDEDLEDEVDELTAAFKSAMERDRS
jgi:hypothetical protein